MADRTTKDALYAEFAAVGKVLANPKRLELLDLLAQGPRSVEYLATAAGLGTSTCSAHLQALRESGLTTARRDGERSTTRSRATTSPDSGTTCAGSPRRTGRTPSSRAAPTSAPTTPSRSAPTELLARLRDGSSVVLDVRSDPEYAGGHLAGALHIPLDELADRLDELPRDHEVVAYCRGRYCVLAHDAVRLLRTRGLRARRAADGVLEWRVAGVPVETGAA